MQRTVVILWQIPTQSYFHLVFAVKHREALIKKSWKNELEMYITGIVQNHKHKLLAIGSMPDHIHIFIGYYLSEVIPDLVEKIKTSSNSWIRKKNYPNSNLTGPAAAGVMERLLIPVLN